MSERETKPKRTSPGLPLKWLQAHLDFDGPECLTWPFGKCTHGYGVLWFRGRQTNASRVACILKHGESQNPGDQAAHICGNGHLGCVHPGHIQWATPSENSHQRKLHGTLPFGENSPTSKLSEADVLRIRKMKGSISARSLSCEYGISISHVYGIWSGVSWAHLSENEPTATIPHKSGVSGIPGVSWHKSSKKWAARVKVNGGRKHVGLFDTVDLAAAALLKAKGASPSPPHTQRRRGRWARLST